MRVRRFPSLLTTARRSLFASGLSLTLLSTLACGVEFPGESRRDRDRVDDDDRRGRGNTDNDGANGGGFGDLFGNGGENGGTPGGNNGGGETGGDPTGNSGGDTGGNTGGSNNDDSALLCTAENHCQVIDGKPTCDDGYIYSLSSEIDVSCRAPTLLESQKTVFNCSAGPFSQVVLYDGLFLGFVEGADEASYVGYFRELPGQNLQTIDITEDAFAELPLLRHNFWVGMTDFFEHETMGTCQLAGSLAATTPAQWLWEDDFCEASTCSFKDNTFTVGEGGTVEWHLEHGVSSGEYSDTYYSRRYGHARVDDSGFINLVFPATDEDDATQFVGLIDDEGDFYDEARGVWMIRQ